MAYALPLLALTLTGCALPGSPVDAQPVAAVASLAKDSIAACTGTPKADGVINYDQIAATGWVIQSRATRLEADDFQHALDTAPVLRPDEYETTVWTHPSHKGEMDVIRWPYSDISLRGHCSVLAVVKDADDVRSVIGAISAIVARPVDKKGELPKGGDFLAPRSDAAPTGYYWQLPQHDIYATVTDDSAIRLEIVAMPDRSKLDQYSSDNPKNRIPTGD